EPGRVEYRLLAPRRSQNGEWILPLLRRERIEARRKRRLACCRLHRAPGLWPRFAVFSPRGKPGYIRRRLNATLLLFLTSPPPRAGPGSNFANSCSMLHCAGGIERGAEVPQAPRP